MMQKKQSRQNVDLFGTFLKKPPISKQSAPVQQVTKGAPFETTESQYDTDPAGTILDYLKKNGVSVVSKMLSDLDGNTKLYLDTIQQLEGFTLVTRDKNDQGQATVRLN